MLYIRIHVPTIGMDSVASMQLYGKSHIVQFVTYATMAFRLGDVY